MFNRAACRECLTAQRVGNARFEVNPFSATRLRRLNIDRRGSAGKTSAAAAVLAGKTCTEPRVADRRIEI